MGDSVIIKVDVRIAKKKQSCHLVILKKNLSAGQLILRGREGVNAEFSILSSCFNLDRNFLKFIKNVKFWTKISFDSVCPAW